MNTRPAHLQSSPSLCDRALEHHQASLKWSLLCCGDHLDQAEELLQELYVDLIEGTLTYEGRSSLKTWLFGVIRWRASTSHRKWTRRVKILRQRWRLDELSKRGGSSIDAGGEPHPQLSDPLRASIDAQRRVTIIDSLNRLSPRQRRVIELVFYHDLTLEEASEVMSISLGSARTHYQRAKQKLSLLLSESEVL
jgi:RNA polymerase sigma-70 factor, ECF subfamily